MREEWINKLFHGKLFIFKWKLAEGLKRNFFVDIKFDCFYYEWTHFLPKLNEYMFPIRHIYIIQGVLQGTPRRYMENYTQGDSKNVVTYQYQ